MPCSRCDRSMTPDRATASASARPCFGPFGHGDGDGPIQRDDGRRGDAVEHAVQGRDLGPVGLVGRGCAGVQRGDRSLELVAADATAAERSVDQRRSLGDLRNGPTSTGLDRPAGSGRRWSRCGSCAGCRAATSDPRGQHVGLVRHQVQQPASQTDGLGGQLATHQLVAVGCRIALVEDEVDRRAARRRADPRGALDRAARTGCRPA